MKEYQLLRNEIEIQNSQVIIITGCSQKLHNIKWIKQVLSYFCSYICACIKPYKLKIAAFMIDTIQVS